MSVHGQRNQVMPEASVKAAFVARFPEFVQWPREAAPGGEGRFVVCLSPQHPFGGTVEALLRDRSIRGAPVEVRELRGETATGCHAVYIAAGDLRLLRTTRGQAVLTVGDHPEFIARGGIINLRVVNERVRFEIDLGASRRVGLAIDSQLLALAIAVHGGQP